MKENTLLGSIDTHVILLQSQKKILTNMLVTILLLVECELDSNTIEPVLALGGKCSFGSAALDSMRLLATNVSGGIVPDSGHWIPEERPSFLTEQLFAFFGGNTTNTIK
jgi:hypothetical protein